MRASSSWQIETVSIEADVDEITSVELAFAAERIGVSSRAVCADGAWSVMLGEARRLTIEGGLADRIGCNLAFSELIQSNSERDVAVASVAIPFDPHSPFSLVIPKIEITGSDYSESRIRLYGSDTERADSRILLDKVLRTASEVNSYRASILADRIDTGDEEQWSEMVRTALELIKDDQLRKIVLSRGARFSLSPDATLAGAYAGFVGRYPRATSYLFDPYAGASPELVLSIQGGRLTSRPLAGTKRRTSGGLLGDSEKDSREHHIVVEQITAGLSAFCHDVAHPPAPSVINFGPIQHLMTTITGHVAVDLNPLIVLGAIAPTAAVSGDPKTVAVQRIATLEGLDRHLYGGLIGTITGTGECEVHLALRNVLFRDGEAEIRTGVGIVRGSTPRSEYLETESKIESVASAIGG